MRQFKSSFATTVFTEQTAASTASAARSADVPSSSTVTSGCPSIEGPVHHVSDPSGIPVPPPPTAEKPKRKRYSRKDSSVKSY